MTHTAAAITIFILTYSVIAIGKFPWLRLDRAGAAFAGSVAMVISGAISKPPRATQSIIAPSRCCSG